MVGRREERGQGKSQTWQYSHQLLERVPTPSGRSVERPRSPSPGSVFLPLVPEGGIRAGRDPGGAPGQRGPAEHEAAAVPACHRCLAGDSCSKALPRPLPERRNASAPGANREFLPTQMKTEYLLFACVCFEDFQGVQSVRANRWRIKRQGCWRLPTTNAITFPLATGLRAAARTPPWARSKSWLAAA